MRHAVTGRRVTYPRTPSRWSFVIVTLAAIAALIASVALAGQSEQAQARPAAHQAPVLAVRGAVPADAEIGAVKVARDKTVAARLAAARVRAAQLAAALTYTVRPGDTLSSVAVRHCGQARAWTGIYAASRARHMTARNANILTAGQHLWLHCGWVPEALRFAPLPPPPPPALVTRAVVMTVTYHGYRHHATVYYHRAYHRSYTAASSTYHAASGSMEACIIARESGGNSQVVNGSGHWGLFQFSESTWIGSGGSASSFGNASAAEQERVFNNAVAARGYSDWAPYDGC